MERVIILDMSAAFLVYERRMYNLDMNTDDFLKEIITSVLEYIEEYDFAEFNIGEYVSATMALYKVHLQSFDYDHFETAISTVAYAIFNNCKIIGAYDTDRILRYRFDSYVGKDLIIRRMSDDEMSNGPY